jgi:hypothetical protein
VARVELADHLGDDVVEVGAVRDVGEQRSVPGAQLLPVVAVHVLDVEVVAEEAPRLGEQLLPLGLRVEIHHQARRRHGLRVTGFGGAVQFERAALLHEELLVVCRESVAVDAARDLLGLALLQ